jgi:parallel beta-helix repeat protein
MIMEQKSVFISYRRDYSRHFARSIFQYLIGHGYDVFLDVNTIDSGDFDRIILNQIGARAHFVLLLANGSLARCVNPGDWVLREIQEAVRLERNIVPVVDEGADFMNEMQHLPQALREVVSRKNPLPAPHFFFDAAMEMLRTRYLKPPSYVTINATPANEQAEVARRMAAIDNVLAGVPGSAKPPISPYTAELVVDVRGSGSFTSINSALQAAPAGARITVRPGTYHETVRLTKPVTIEGQGGTQQVILESDTTNCLVMDTDEATVSGLGIRCTAGAKGVNCYAIDIPKGRLILRGCDVTCDSSACIGVHNVSARPYILDCVIHDGNQTGLFFYEKGGGTVEDCQIYGNKLAGIEIREEAAPTVRRCNIHSGKAGGVYIHKNGFGLIEDCQIHGNALAGMQIKAGANPTVRRCHLFDGKEGGFFINDEAFGTIEDCQVYGNTLAGVEIKSGSSPTIRRCVMRDGKGSGLFANDNARGLIEDSEVYGNTLSGIQITTGSNPTIRNTTFRDGKGSGVIVNENGLGLIEGCRIIGNAKWGFEIREGGNPTIRRCTITKNGYEAVWSHTKGLGTVEDCDLRGNARGAWDIDATSSVTRRNNQE